TGGDRGVEGAGAVEVGAQGTRRGEQRVEVGLRVPGATAAVGGVFDTQQGGGREVRVVGADARGHAGHVDQTALGGQQAELHPGDHRGASGFVVKRVRRVGEQDLVAGPRVHG